MVGGVRGSTYRAITSTLNAMRVTAKFYDWALSEGLPLDPERIFTPGRVAQHLAEQENEQNDTPARKRLRTGVFRSLTPSSATSGIVANVRGAQGSRREPVKAELPPPETRVREFC